MVDIYNIRNTQLLIFLRAIQYNYIIYILFNLIFQRAVKLVELISSSSHTVATQSSIKLIKYAC